MTKIADCQITYSALAPSSPNLEEVSEALQVFNLIVNRLLPPPHQQLHKETNI